MISSSSSCAILFSGGTDSTCTAAVLAEVFKTVHLITFYDISNINSPLPIENVKRLKKAFPDTTFIHVKINTDKLIKHLSFSKYFTYLLKYKLISTANCFYIPLSWHIRTLIYCLEHKITTVADGLTKELLYLPGHMEKFLREVTSLYTQFEIQHQNTVREWEIPEEQSIMDRFVVDQHGFLFPSEEKEKKFKKTTGQYLYKKNILPHPNVKGSVFDKQMQHDCYPFVLYKILIFWVYLKIMTYNSLEKIISLLAHDKILDIIPILDSYQKTHTLKSLPFYSKEEVIHYDY